MLSLCILFILLSNASTTRRDLAVKFNRSLAAVLLVSMLTSLNSNNYISLKEGISLFGGLFHNTSLTILFHTFLFFISLLIIELTSFYPRFFKRSEEILEENTDVAEKSVYNESISSLTDINAKQKNEKTTLVEAVVDNLDLSNKTGEQFGIIEYPLVILFVVVGATFLLSSSDIVSIFLSIELQSYGLYLLCALYRNSESSTGAGLTYFLLGGLSSCFILLAFGLLYTNSGTSSLDNYYLLTNLSETKYTMHDLAYWYNNNYINYCLLILSIGFLFKISAAPFHFWSPDVYDAIPTIVTTFVATIAKISILVFLVEIVHYTASSTVTNLTWINSLLLSSLLSLLIGTILGLNQSRIKRLLAYSTISHLGFMLLAISINSIESMQAFLFYLMQYSITNVNSFIIVIAIGYTMYMYNKSQGEKVVLDENNSPIQFTGQLKGYYTINPLVAISFTIVVFSFVGIPPLVGFFGKQMVLSAALDKGYIFISLVAILTSVISAVYYLNIVKEIFFYKPEYEVNNLKQNGDNILASTISNKDFSTMVSINLSTTISVLTLVILVFMLSPQEWLSIANILAIFMFT